MTRSDLIRRLSENNPTLLLADAEHVVDLFFGDIIAALAAGDRVELRGFGAFGTKQRAPRVGRNPRTGTQVSVAGKRHPFFKCGKALRDQLNGIESKND